MASIVTETSCQHGKREVDFVTARRDFVRLRLPPREQWPALLLISLTSFVSEASRYLYRAEPKPIENRCSVNGMGTEK